ncbi:hypothetical protein [Phenylobacterium montanum]|uniref:Uncharacterized protein n=1 Tax=Phenylobacterium montanum TaxID=2823693 RepID=A0A975IW81_9CAUL|nr:hypothetical protein [Caulobacter sp. S6]QUD88111.1 hypothetical protein KCG34_24290 [Caulobacter sp. S6]
MASWSDKYAYLIGRRIEAVIWMPMTSDTPQLVTEFKLASFSFTGAAFVAFAEDHKLFLTWRQSGQNMVLSEGLDQVWVEYSLDRVRADTGELWGGLEDGTLKSAEFFTAPSIESGEVVGIRHVVESGGHPLHFWIGTGGSDFIGDMDDLWVGVGIEPPNFTELTSVGRVGD